MKIWWATKLRGFLRHLSDASESLDFCDNGRYYEVKSKLDSLKSRLIRCFPMDVAGIFQIIPVQGVDCSLYGSFNRFLQSDKPYFIYLENPTALYHYCLRRISYPMGRRRFSKCMHDPHLRGIICMSDACKNTFERINGAVPRGVRLETIYPFVPDNRHVDMERIREKSFTPELRILYCVQGIRFVSKGGLEVLEAVNRLHNEKIRLTVITKLSDVDRDVIEKIQQSDYAELFDFTFPYEELEKIYAKSNILIQPTSDDSYALTVLEAMKAGCAVIASRLYAIPEMVADGVNGFLVEPKYWFFDRENIPNPAVWNHRKKTIHRKKVSERMVDELSDRINRLYENRSELLAMSAASYKRATDDRLFGEKGIIAKWETILHDME